MKLIGPSILCLTLFLTFSSSGIRASETYKWVDKNGIVHFTDNPEELPEPMRSKVLRKLDKKREKEEQERRKAGKRPAPVKQNRARKYYKKKHDKIPPGSVDGKTPGGKSPEKGDGINAEVPAEPGSGPAGKAMWRARMNEARRLVSKLEVKCENLKAQRDRSRRNSLILVRPIDRQKAKQLSEDYDKCEERLEEARRNLEVNLPNEARRAGVPRGWLE